MHNITYETQLTESSTIYVPILAFLLYLMYMKFANTCDNKNNDKKQYVMKPRHASKSSFERRAKGERSLRELGHTTENEKRRAICNPAMPKTISDIFV